MEYCNWRYAMENRRRVDRQSAGWLGSYQLANTPDSEWRDCRVVDISMLGLGITIEHREPAQLLGRLIAVDLPCDGISVSVRLEGVIKNAAEASGSVRVGVEFLPLSETERSITALLNALSYGLIKH
jgi:c-di-GMP-binding flagellar brake protein YcgR